MAKIKKYKIARRLGSSVYEKTQSQKFMLAEQKRRKSRTGRPKRPTDYGMSLIQKQRVRFSYGVSEKQFSNSVKKAFESAKHGEIPADTLFKLLEKRLDNVIYRSGISKTRAFGRQLVTHGHITVNGKKIDVPSYSVKNGDIISIREGSKSKTVFIDLEKTLKSTKAPSWLKIDSSKLTIEITGEPKNPDKFFNFQAVIEFYSR
ncbi:MAG: 30S ribosomal protein S4 [Candidatus Pacebacteria bacterium]|nr:30S ribosomal protein S4 [Candidatus Paceibacterota bacterium]